MVHKAVAYIPTDEDGTQPFMLCRDCAAEAGLDNGRDSLPVYSWEMHSDDSCDTCLQLIADTL